jgi:hypothetical protein
MGRFVWAAVVRVAARIAARMNLIAPV